MTIRVIISLRHAFAAAALAALAGCASYSGYTLKPGSATAAEVEATMGKPAATLALAGGASAWYYPRAPYGRHTYVAILGADGRLRALEQRLTEENFARLAAGTTTMQEVRELLGPPNNETRFERQGRVVWEYRFLRVTEERILWVQFSYDGVVREVLNMFDFRSKRFIGRA